MFGNFLDTLGNIFKPKSIGIASANVIDLFNKLNGIKSTGIKIDDVVNKIDSKADLTIGKNLFNKDTCTDGYFINVAGNITVGASLTYSDFIKVEPSTTYYCSTGARFVTFYDINKNPVNLGYSTATNTIIVPANVYYIRITLEPITKKNTCQLEKGTAATIYETYYRYIPRNLIRILDIESNISNKIPYYIGKNLFNKDNILSNSYYSNTGTIGVYSDHYQSEYIEVVEGQQYISNKSMRFVAYFNADKQFITGDVQNVNTFTVPAGVKYVIVTITGIVNLNGMQLEAGSVSTTFTPYFRGINPNLLQPVVYPNITNIASKQHFLSTVENNIYHKEIVKRANGESNIELVSSLTGFSKVGSKSRIDVPTVGTYTGSSIVYDLSLNVLSTKNFNIIVNNLSKTTALKTLSIGDSFTDIGTYVKRVKDILPNITPVGMCKTVAGTDVPREGRSGWTLAQYMTLLKPTTTGNFSPFLHPDNPYKYYGPTGFWAYIKAGIGPAYAIDAFVQICNTTGFETTGFKSSPALNDVMYYTAGAVFKVYNGTTWVDIPEATLNFKIDITKYYSTWNIPIADVVTFLFGFNDFYNLEPSNVESSFTTWSTNLDNLIAKFKLANANTKFVILTCPSTNDSMKIKGNYALFEFYNLLVNYYEPKEADGIYISDTRVALDRKYGNKFSMELPFKIFTENSNTILLEGNDVHCNTSGMNQIGEKLAATIQHIRP